MGAAELRMALFSTRIVGALVIAHVMLLSAGHVLSAIGLPELLSAEMTALQILKPFMEWILALLPAAVLVDGARLALVDS
ncbi:hypothetical protein GON01_12665 [Sphingomonas sp. MAH-20]|jgi:hypothetical protein|uniref:Uncharacterized protein n=1 Tax=Sphingomonas horti TaxID=2682842 RepID=A0A6I4J272_9SPHN|nr:MULTISPECIES: hypothetical protein [Sphingomonas]MBA2918751.1 hypothetical protein [Sphingomonas sp. CGMCC 1.13658]MVO78782.1 hypothetical protein [Sphingomonas horti]